MKREIIQTDRAPQAIGTYSQAVRSGSTVYMSGQIPLVPDTMELVEGDMQAQISVCSTTSRLLRRPRAVHLMMWPS